MSSIQYTIMRKLYIDLRDQFLSVGQKQINEQYLLELKESYAHNINSRRKLSRINDIESLIKLLEIRDVLNTFNIEPFVDISKRYIKDSVLLNKLLDYEYSLKRVLQPSLYNMYLKDNVQAIPAGETETNDRALDALLVESLAFHAPHSTQSSEHPIHILHTASSSVPNPKRNLEKEALLQQKVLLYVSERLGHSWRDVARHLNVRECEIDTVQTKYPYKLKEQSYEVLQKCISAHPSHSWKLHLTRALEKGRRKDLKEDVENLLLSNEQ